MSEFIAFEEHIRVNGQAIKSVLDGMGEYKDIGIEMLVENNLKDIVDEEWYSQQDWLNVFKYIAEEIGKSTLFNIGKSILDNAKFPSGIDNIEKGLSLINVAYHMNHQKAGQIMFNSENGEMLEGIGYYGYEKIGDNEAKMVCKTPYPCEFDRGIITSMGRRFEATVNVIVDIKVKNKKDGVDSSTYIITW